jgi:hypothetical protein
MSAAATGVTGGVDRISFVIAKSASDEAIQPCFASLWIASRSLSSGGALRRTVGSQ